MNEALSQTQLQTDCPVSDSDAVTLQGEDFWRQPNLQV